MHSYNYGENMNQSFEESYKDPLIENSLFQLPIEEIGPLFCFGNDGRTTNETQKIQKTNLPLKTT